ncbi:hypothetical protein G8764_16345 [Pseudomaricurvus alcaniphilus]|uniref:hypothetical protein n=1 Tax=Pseudomaricurvus alcaniphilus TaxID=1166482 RepID=UPI00140887EF|nr:hypothetical protein [Pseudomaricurvus alcaniphilus]NHN38882.1 hypothetical protein [Pseudomaricurvus alcaniphilus]
MKHPTQNVSIDGNRPSKPLPPGVFFTDNPEYIAELSPVAAVINPFKAPPLPLINLEAASYYLSALMRPKLGKGKFSRIRPLAVRYLSLKLFQQRLTIEVNVPGNRNLAVNHLFQAMGEQLMVHLSLALSSGKSMVVLVDGYQSLDRWLQEGVMNVPLEIPLVIYRKITNSPKH